MRISNYCLIGSFALLLGLGMSGLLYSQTRETSLPALLAGNARFTDGTSARKVTSEQLHTLAAGQHPLAVVLTCSDSRVSPELLFDQGMGDIFVVRTAGNVVDDVAIGSIEYGVEHLHAPLLVVMGHQNCGAIKAAMEAKAPAPEAHGTVDHIGAILAMIAPAIKTAKAATVSNDAARMEVAIRANVQNVAAKLRQKSPIIAEALNNGTLKLTRAEYSLETGKIELLP